MIPKKLHYCWFGGNPLPDSAKKCIESWKRFCSDYEIIEWNESNFDIDCCDYVREAYQAKKWAFVSDVARLSALVNQGGIYMDTDVEVIRPLDNLLQSEAFVCFEKENAIATCLMACQPDHPFFRDVLKMYDSLHFFREDGTNDQTTNVARITNYCVQQGLKLDGSQQTIAGMTIFPSDFFSPINFDTGKMCQSSNTYSIHWFDASWFNPAMQYQKKLNWKLNRVMPKTMAYNVSRFIAVTKFNGIQEALKKMVAKKKK